jgi:hypothetical protein
MFYYILFDYVLFNNIGEKCLYSTILKKQIYKNAPCDSRALSYSYGIIADIIGPHGPALPLLFSYRIQK